MSLSERPQQRVVALGTNTTDRGTTNECSYSLQCVGGRHESGCRISMRQHPSFHIEENKLDKFEAETTLLQIAIIRLCVIHLYLCSVSICYLLKNHFYSVAVNSVWFFYCER